ncbi:MAG: Plug domain-containing protein [Sphingopyxis sp.]|nr:Plug domain-containing protein [Sphingopyxis sp.]
MTSWLAGAAVFGATSTAQAQTASPAPADAPAPDATVTTAADGRTSYPAAFFTQFAPATALDIVQRVPGFGRPTRAMPDVRGFGGAAGNLVIDGERPSAKSDSLATILSRIPASRVLRVEVGSGDLFGAEYSGRPQVANLILADGGGLAGTVEASIARDYTGSLTPQGSISALLRRGPSTFTASVGYENEDYLEEGTDTIRALPGRSITEFRVKQNDIRDQEWFATASWAFDGGPIAPSISTAAMNATASPCARSMTCFPRLARSATIGCRSCLPMTSLKSAATSLARCLAAVSS